MKHRLVIFFVFACCVVTQTVGANESTSKYVSSSSAQNQPSFTIVRAFYKSGHSALYPIDIKVVVNGDRMTIVELKDPKTNIWNNADCICQPILRSNDMSKDFNYQAYHQIYGHIYFVGSGLSLESSSSANSFAVYTAANSSCSGQSTNNAPLVKSRMGTINEQMSTDNSYSRIESGYYQKDNYQWQILSLEINYSSAGTKLVRYKVQNSNDWIIVNCFCSKIPSDSPLIEEFSYYVTIQDLGKIYF